MATLQKFLKSGTQVFVKVKGEYKPFALDKERIIENSVEIDNPLPEGEGKIVQTTFDGVSVYFLPKKIRTRYVLDKDTDLIEGSTLLDEQLYLLHYDIPSTGESAGFTPCERLYRSGAVPVSESVWLVRKGNMPYNLIADMEDMGCNVNPCLLDLSETKAKVAEAIAFLQYKIECAIDSANKSMEKAQDLYEEKAKTDADLEAATKKFVERAGQVRGRLTKLRKEMCIGASTLGITEAAYNPEILTKVAALVKAKGMEKAKAYKLGTKALEKVGTPDAIALAEQAKNDVLPVFVMSEFLQDADDDETAQEINKAFSESETFDLTSQSE